MEKENNKTGIMQSITGKTHESPELIKNPGNTAILPEDIPDKKFPVKTLQDFFDKLPKNLEVWKDLFLSLEIEGIKSKHTHRAYKSSLDDFLEFYEDYNDTLDMGIWKAQHTARYIENLEENKKSPKTVELRFNVIKKFCKWVKSKRENMFLLQDPLKDIKAPAEEPVRPKGLTKKQINKLIDVLKTRMGNFYYGKNYENSYGTPTISRTKRDYAIVYLMLNTGLRRQEVVDINIDQLQDKYLMRVKCKGNMYRNILLTDGSDVIIDDYIKCERWIDQEILKDAKVLFLPAATRKSKNKTGRLSPDAITKLIKSISEKANESIKNEKEKIPGNPHMLRHTHALKLLQTGSDITYVAKRLGHRSINTTRIYTAPSEEEESEMINKAEVGK